MRTIHLVKRGERVYCDVCRHPVEGYVKFAHGGQLHEARHVVRLCLSCLREAAVVWARGADDPLAQSLWGNKWPGRKHLAAGVVVYRELAAVGGRAV